MITKNSISEVTARPLTIKEWAELLSSKNDDLIMDFSNHILHASSESNYKAFFFETKGVNMNNASEKQFEYVLVQAQNLHDFTERVGPEPETFQEYLDCIPSSRSCCAFYNLGRTARLIAPKNLGDYSHIRKFLESASKNEIIQFWNSVAREYLSSLYSNPSKSFWLSTSGLGVSWLHFRIDERPKYYTYLPFKQER